MTNYLRAYRDKDADTGGAGVMSFVASTGGIKRDGLEIDQSRWDLGNYRANPVVLWAHDYAALPIGRADVEVRDGALHADVTWDTSDELATRVAGKYERGFLNAVSVGWRDVDNGKEGVSHELLDVSAVPVPGDPDALAERTRDALRSLLRDFDGQPTDEAEPDWPTIATEMVRVMVAPGDDADAEGRYRALLPAYRKLGKTAPEWVDERAALHDDTWSDLFLEGELMVADATGLEARAGAVLNARNKADLREAMVRIKRVLESAGSIEDDAESEPEQTDEQESEREVDEYTIFLREIMEALSNE
jgi:hypothetical protein